MGLSEQPNEAEERGLPFDFQLQTFRKLQHLRLGCVFLIGVSFSGIPVMR